MLNALKDIFMDTVYAISGYLRGLWSARRLSRILIGGAFLLLVGCCDDCEIHSLSSDDMGGLKVTNFSSPEVFGRWSLGERVVFEFDHDLPENFVLQLDVGAAYGPNAGDHFVILIANQRNEFEGPKNADVMSAKRYDFQVNGLPRGTRQITIKIPKPTSPKKMGAGDDPRELGIAIKSISILPIERSFICELLGFYGY